MFRPVKKSLCIVAVISVLAGSYAFAAPPKLPDLTPDLLQQRKLMTTHVRQIAARIKYWAKNMLLADSPENVVSARESLLADYNLHKYPSYQDAFANLSSRLFTAVIKDGKGIRMTDPLREIKLANVAIALCDMSNQESSKSYYAMVNSGSAAMRFLGWKGLRDLRSSGLNKAELIELFKAAKKAMATETNSNVLAMVFQTLNFTTSDTDKLSEKYRKSVSKVAFDTIKPIWPKLLKNIGSTQNAEDIFNIGSAISTITGSATMGDAAKQAQATKLVLSVTEATVARFEKIQSSMAAVQKKIDAANKKAKASEDDDTRKPSFRDDSTPTGLTPEQLKLRKDITKLDSLSQACKILLVNCEFALNSLVNKEESFFVSQMTVSDAQGDAMKMALFEWKQALESK